MEYQSFCEWVVDPGNWNANVFTLLSLVVSALISLIISGAFFHKGNRDNVRSSLLHPIKQIVAQPVSQENSKEMKASAESYCSRYLRAGERRTIRDLIIAYQAVCLHDDTKMQVKALISHFLNKLNEEGIDAKTYPIYDNEHHIVDYCIPPDTCGYIYLDLSDSLSDCSMENEQLTPCERINVILNGHRKAFTPKDDINFFDGCTIESVVASSQECRERDEKFEKLDAAKARFLNLRSVRSLS